MARVIHFEISASDPQKVSAFYRNVFGWDVQKWDGPAEYWLVRTGAPDSPGIDGGIFRPDGLFSGTVNTVGVEDLDASMEQVRTAGGEIVGNKDYIPGIGHFVYGRDVEGNLFGMIQPDPQASM